MLEPDTVRTTSHGRAAPAHLLAQARVHALTVRPVGPFRVAHAGASGRPRSHGRAQLNPIHHQ
ncbi:MULTISPECIES: hypothetical protein [unclassified Curtobacterium]|uniref:hypothetical protein n=1 Tax=unclassified Curtobacterium TaxID=257496 RepID=UPI0008DE3088|nr:MULTISPECIES: hypothetical protein [unclassified Curtobacterium]OIH93074.1 hypothetical protein BIU92_09390 [Curtobacterium sp. MCBA15_003]OII10690.1 hypothetical protein BIU97_11415 [Curtobacterium sp. MCBA15_009]OII29987.1 hypothetical protein BIU94_10130 [Curtobacterium sp. MMLR14_006]